MSEMNPDIFYYDAGPVVIAATAADDDYDYFITSSIIS